MLLITLSCFGTVWHVNNNANTLYDFTTLQAAHDAAAVQPGDTLYLYGSPNGYGSLTATKKLYIIGPGYFLTENTDRQVVPYSASAVTITLNAGSEYSVITGMTVSKMVVNASHQTIKRNLITGSSTVICQINSASDIIVLQNFIRTTNSYSSGLNITGTASTGILVSNNIIEASASSSYSINTEPNLMLTYANNTLYGTVNISRSDFYNNILRYGSFYGDNSSVFNNIGSSSQFGSTNGNQANVSMSNVFASSGSTDAYYMLRIGSPAIAAGLNGEDCGAYGGSLPYVLSGMPSEIPTIYFFSSIGAGYQLPIHIKAKTHQ
jgi:hypothetical protein